jgi:hypothetical protein
MRFRHVSWRTLILAALAAVAFVAVAEGQRVYPGPVARLSDYAESGVSGRSIAPEAPGYGNDTSIAPDYYPYPGGTPSAEDTREFVKTHYSAQMRSRDVGALARHVETTIRGYEGRIDSQSVSTERAYLRFVVPAGKYETFRAELEGLVGSRFLDVSISSENRLGEKQSIEEQIARATSTLAAAKRERQSLVSAHAGAVASYDAKITAAKTELSDLQEEQPNGEREAQIAMLKDEITALESALARENAAYEKQLASIDARISYAERLTDAADARDEHLMDDLATVDGLIEIRWIGLWEYVQAYLPGYWIPALFALATAVSFYFDRRRFYRESRARAQAA